VFFRKGNSMGANKKRIGFKPKFIITEITSVVKSLAIARFFW
jgi:hypothetical protein